MPCSSHIIRDATWNSFSGQMLFSQTFNSFSNNVMLCLTLLHSERPKLHTILAFLSAIGLRWMGTAQGFPAVLAPLYESTGRDVLSLRGQHLDECLHPYWIF